MATCWETAAHSAYDMFSKYKYLIVNLVFSHLGFWSGNFFLIDPFPYHCLLVSFLMQVNIIVIQAEQLVIQPLSPEKEGHLFTQT